MKQLILLFAILILNVTSLFSQFNQWVNAGSMLYPRQDHTATLLSNGKVLIVGGMNALQHAELYDPNSDTFSETGNTIKLHYQGTTATLLNNGKVLIVGGVNAQQFAELYDPTTGNFELLDTLNSVHCYHSATLLKDGRVLIAGGQNNIGPQTHAVCEIFDPITNKFTLTVDSLNDHRSSHKAVLLPDGKVLIVGGIQTTTPGSGIYLNSCEIYDPTNDTFTPTQALNQPRVGHQATLLENGKVLVTCGSYYQKYGEIFDPLIETWSLTAEMNIMRRNFHAAARLHSGKVLLAGGYSNAPISLAEIYDPAANSFTIIDSMKSPRMSFCATKLKDGSVLVTGGYNGTAALTSTERYLVDTNEVVSVRDVNVHSQIIPSEFQLYQNYPNPFNPSTKIKYTIPALTLGESVSEGQVKVSLKVYDILGNEITTLVNEEKFPGSYEVEFNSTLGSNQLTSGVYFYKLQTGKFFETKKMILLR